MRPRFWAVLLALAAAAALAVAHGSERWASLVPCALCLWERWPYRVAFALAVVAWFMPARALFWLIAVTMLAGAVIAAAHVGVEHHWWPSPIPQCAAPSFGGGSIAEQLARMPAAPAKPCDEPAYLIQAIPVSFAAMNLLASLIFLGLAVHAARRSEGR